MSLATWSAHALIGTGSALILLAGAGVVRFPDALTRANAATKATGLGLAAILAGVAIEMASLRATIVLTFALMVQFLTAPVSGHIIGRAAYRSGAPLWHGTHTDDLALHYGARRENRDGDAAEPTDPTN